MEKPNMTWDKDNTKFEGSPTKLLFGAEAAPDADMDEETGETCVWCEHNTAEITDEIWNDTRMDDCDTATYQVVKCTHCGAEYHIGKKFISFVTYVKKGKPEMSVDCGCFNCKWNTESPIMGQDGIACAGCNTEPNGQLTHSDPTAKNNWTPIERDISD